MTGWLVTLSWKDNKSPDEYRVFIEWNNEGLSPKEQATRFFKQALDDEDLYSANLCHIKDSTEAHYLDCKSEYSKDKILTDKDCKKLKKKYIRSQNK